MKNEIKNDVLVISLEGSLTGPHVTGPIIEMIKNNLESGIKKVVFNMEGMKLLIVQVWAWYYLQFPKPRLPVVN